jgi:Circularly permutated YpsA SLOG family
MPVLRKIISEGQTGADRAGLDFAIEVGRAHGGYVPKGRKAEDGRIDEKYTLAELSSSSYPSEQNAMFGRATERLSSA